MIFCSPIFLFIFLPVTLIGYIFIDKKYKNLYLMLASLIFYSWSGVKYAILVILSITYNYFIGIQLGKKHENIKKKKMWLVLGVAFNLGLLIFYKYFNFIIDNIIKVGSVFNSQFTIASRNIILPIGISFFTFQIMSYIIDVYRGTVKTQKSIINLALYVLLFPQLIAGPIVRYIDIEKQIHERDISIDKVRSGVQRFIIGIGKKVLISNSVGYVADFVFNETKYYGNMGITWIGIICYALQIYYDFSGYSDMAIGLGRLFGFEFMENFNYPYISTSIKEFWSRWHISLSTWFRDYLYIPLGGNRKGKVKTYRNLLIVFFVTGLWHGASWNFILWGLFYGVFLILERGRLGYFIKKIPKVFQLMYTLLIVLIAWVFFRADNISLALSYIKGMFSFNFTGFYEINYVMSGEVIFYIIIGLIFATPIVKVMRKKLDKYIFNKPLFYDDIIEICFDFCRICIFLVSIFYMAGSGFNPFIYFRF